jgi:hypothetical protein
MLKKMNNRWKGRSQSLLEEIRIIPQEAVHVVWRKVWRLRAIVVMLIAVCTALAMVNLKDEESVTRLLHLEAEKKHLETEKEQLDAENREKDATIEKLQEEMKVLENKLSFKQKLDRLVTKVHRQVPRIDRKTIRSAAEKALAHTKDPALYLAIGVVEAGLRADVVHTDGVALGMHGLSPRSWHSFLKKKGIMQDRDDYFDPAKSFKGSEAVLTALVRECGSLEKALRYYNGGVRAAAGEIPQSTAYAKRVMRLRSVFAA